MQGGNHTKMAGWGARQTGCCRKHDPNDYTGRGRRAGKRETAREARDALRERRT